MFYYTSNTSIYFHVLSCFIFFYPFKSTTLPRTDPVSISTDQAIPAEEGDLSPGKATVTATGGSVLRDMLRPTAVVKKSGRLGVQIMKKNNTSRVNVNTQ